MGPSNLDSLDLEPEDIGLPKPTILFDYPSPTYYGSSRFGVHLSAEEIKKCKMMIRKGNHYTMAQGQTSQQQKVHKTSTQQSPPVTQYTVEFPEETQNKVRQAPSPSKSTLETLSVMELDTRSNLKRRAQLLSTSGSPPSPSTRKKMKEYQDALDTTRHLHHLFPNSTRFPGTLDFTAEEDGLNLPPKGP